MSDRLEPVPVEGRPSLVADCGQCFGLCCVALPFTESRDFAFDKAAGEPCRYLAADFRCGIHARLRQHGFAGCTRYDCFGAGQRVSQATFAGQDWRAAPGTATSMYAVFSVVRQLHEMLVYLGQAIAVTSAVALHDELSDARDEIQALASGSSESLLALDVPVQRRAVGELLGRASRLARAAGRPRGATGRSMAGADLVGADLRGADLRAADLRGALLIAADLRTADLRAADLLGADLRAADMRAADLGGALFLTQPQLDAAQGDGATNLPASVHRPEHWPR